MTEEKKTESVVPETEKPTGSSSEGLIKEGSSPNEMNVGEGKSKIDLENFVTKKSYEELQSKLGEQGSELGELREFTKEVAPLIEKLRDNPALVEAVMTNKISLDLAQAVLDDKIKIEEATAVAEAHEDVKKELGEKKYEKASKEEIEKLVTSKINEIKAELEGKDLEKKTVDFIKDCPDYLDYADQISDYFKTHPDEWDVERVYYYVKGKDMTDKGVKENAKRAAEAAKEMAANAGGGGSQAGGKFDGRSIVDDLIAGGRNPNIL